MLNFTYFTIINYFHITIFSKKIHKCLCSPYFLFIYTSLIFIVISLGIMIVFLKKKKLEATKKSLF